jgi:copper(I)-binding protein
MKPIITLLLAVALAACGQPAELEVADPWTRDTAGRTANAAVFMTITSPVDDRLVRASSPVAARTDLMTMTDDGGTMAMIYLEAIDLPAGEPVRLVPTGLHVWLDGLNAPLRAGETFPLTLEFETASPRQVEVSVIAPAATPPGADRER